MASIFVRNVDPKALKCLKARARREGRSLQSLMKGLIDREAGGEKLSMAEARKLSEAFHRRFRGRKFPDAASLIREDRER